MDSLLVAEARSWLSKYAPTYYSPEMTDQETTEAITQAVQAIIQKLIAGLDENIPEWRQLAAQGGQDEC